MPLGRRRKSSLHTENAKEQDGPRMTVNHVKVCEESPPNDKVTEDQVKDKQEEDGSAANITSIPKRTGAVTRSRVPRTVRRPKRDLSPPQSPVKKNNKKEPKQNTTGTPETKTKRNWELWSSEDKDTFFEGVFEHGKDFDAIQNLIAQKCKKRGVQQHLIKNKDQVRHFYYRTWHKISKYVHMGTEVKKETQELYGLINYGILWRKYKTVLTEKNGIKLDELVHTGSTSLKFKGKNFRIKTPVCNALKRLNNVEDVKEITDAKEKVPEKIEVEFNAKSNSAWAYVQEMSQNPRLRMSIKPDQRLSSIMKFLNQKWKPHRQKLRDKKGETADQSTKMFTVFPHRACPVEPITLKHIKEPQLKLAFNSYKDNIKNSPSSSKVKKGEHNKFVNEIPSEHTSVIFDSPRSSKCSQSQLVPSSFRAMLDGDNAMFPDELISSPATKSSTQTTDNGDNPITCSGDSDAITTTLVCDNACAKMLKCDNCLEVGPGPSNVNVLSNPSQSGQSNSATDEGKHGNQENTVGSCDTNSDKEVHDECQEKETRKMEGILEKGWTLETSESVTFAELYLMFGKDGKIKLEYEWCDRDEDATQRLTNMLLRLIHLATTEFTDFSTKTAPNPNSPCHTCGMVKAKLNAGRGSKGQKTNSRNPLASRLAEGLVDAGTQTNQSLMKKPEVPIQSKDAVFRVPVAGPSYFQTKNPRTIINPVDLLSQTKSKKIRTVNRRPMVVQRQLLPKSAPSQMLAFVPMSGATSQGQNPPSGITAQGQRSSNGPTPVLPKGGAPRVNVSSTVSSSGPNRPISSRGGKIMPNSLVVTVANNSLLSPLSTTSVLNMPILTSTPSSSDNATIKTSSSSSLLQNSISPPNISTLLDMSLSNLPADPDSTDKFIDELSIGNSSNFASILESAKPQATSSALNTPVKNNVRLNGITSPMGSPPRSLWLNGEESGDVSLLTLLTESTPAKREYPGITTMHQGLISGATNLFNDNSRDSLMMDPTFQSNFNCMMNESSIDYVSKFAELADIITSEDPRQQQKPQGLMTPKPELALLENASFLETPPKRRRLFDRDEKNSDLKHEESGDSRGVVISIPESNGSSIGLQNDFINNGSAISLDKNVTFNGLTTNSSQQS